MKQEHVTRKSKLHALILLYFLKIARAVEDKSVDLSYDWGELLSN